MASTRLQQMQMTGINLHLSNDDPHHEDQCHTSRDPIETAQCGCILIEEISEMQQHRNTQQCMALWHALDKCPEFFGNELKTHPCHKARPDSEPNATPSHK